ncbi:MAG: DUF418 domain-containing protein [Ilumatobacteraceae bacterium]
MALTPTPRPNAPRPPTAPADRLPGPDVVRAVALIGVVVMNYHGYLLLADRGRSPIGDGWSTMFFDPWVGPLSTRFAATFVLVAGVGVTLLTRRSIGSPDRVTAARWRLARRGVLLYVVGLLLDQVWPGTILPYYGVMFVIAASLFTLRTRWIVLIGSIAVAAGTGVRGWVVERERAGHSTRWLTAPDPQSVDRYVFGVVVNGTHPLLPWLGFLCAGIVLGRLLHTSWWRRTALGLGATMVIAAALASLAVDGSTRTWGDVVLSIRPFEGGVAYVVSALGTALIAYAALDWLATRHRELTDPLRRAGQMTLTLYLLHVVVFEVLVEWLGWIEPAGIDTALAFALVFWVVAISLAVAWQQRFGRGPAEYVYRSFGG